MQKLRVVGLFGKIISGKVKLTDEQARARKHNLKQVKKNVYEIVNPIGFKAGEEIEYDGPKMNRRQFAPFEEVVAAPKQSGKSKLPNQDQETASPLAALRTEVNELYLKVGGQLDEHDRTQVADAFDYAEIAEGTGKEKDIKSAITELERIRDEVLDIDDDGAPESAAAGAVGDALGE